MKFQSMKFMFIKSGTPPARSKTNDKNLVVVLALVVVLVEGGRSVFVAVAIFAAIPEPVPAAVLQLLPPLLRPRRRRVEVRFGGQQL
jgi:hypothetical protein